MKFKMLEWSKVGEEWQTTLYDRIAGWVSAIIFKKGDSWFLHYESRDEAEFILKDTSFEMVKVQAQDLHNNSVKEEFFE